MMDPNWELYFSFIPTVGLASPEMCWLPVSTYERYYIAEGKSTKHCSSIMTTLANRRKRATSSSGDLPEWQGWDRRILAACICAATSSRLCWGTFPWPWGCSCGAKATSADHQPSSLREGCPLKKNVTRDFRETDVIVISNNELSAVMRFRQKAVSINTEQMCGEVHLNYLLKTEQRRLITSNQRWKIDSIPSNVGWKQQYE